jgi:LuxR family maltose regulon positive regulatory protein
MSTLATPVAAPVLLRTKLHRPLVTGELVPRPDLLERLERGRGRPLTLVSAPAGYGKTTLVSTWLERCGLPAAWLSLDEHDGDPALFLSYLLAALQTLFPDVGSETQALLEPPRLPPLPVLARSLLNELDRIEQPFLLVLEDYHTLRGLAVHELVGELLRHPPRGMHLVLVTRRDPPLPLANLRAQGRMTEIRFQDLRFTPARTATFLRDVMGLEVDDAALQAAHQRTEGWVTGLRLTALCLRDSHDAGDRDDCLQGSSRYVGDYLLGEILARQAPAVQEYLLHTSILERFCAPLCAAVCTPAAGGEPALPAEAFLEWLGGANLFSVPLDGAGQWVRYHRLFRELLRRQLERRHGPGEIAALHARASRWFAGQGLIEEGLEHAIAAGDMEGAVRLVAQHRHNLMNGERWRRLGRWLALFPRELIERRAHLLITEAWLQHKLFRLQGIFAQLERVEALLEGGDPTLSEAERRELGGEIAAMRGCSLHFAGQGLRALEDARHAAQVTPAGRWWVRGEALMYQAVAYQMVGQSDTAHETLDRILAEDRQGGGSLQPNWYTAHQIIDWLGGDLKGFERVARQSVSLAGQRRMRQHHGYALYALGLVHYHWNDLEQAGRYFAQVVELGYYHHAEIFLQSLCGLALTYQALGQPDEARRTSEQASAFALKLRNASMRLEAQTLEARLALLRGEVPDPRPWADRVTDLYPFYIFVELPAVTLAKVLLAQGTPAALRQAGDLLSRLRDRVDATHSTPGQIEVMALQALLCDAQGEGKAALDLLERALALARPGGTLRLFVDLGPRMANLLGQLQEGERAGNGSASYVRRILSAFAASQPTPAPASQEGLIEPLTEREMEILALLERRLSNKEIAARLVIAPGTVKSHTIHIYQKLNVNGRRQAVNQARALGILPPR